MPVCTCPLPHTYHMPWPFHSFGLILVLSPRIRLIFGYEY
jgi:hypothetical protein